MPSEKPFNIDTYPTQDLPQAVFAAVREYIEFNYLKAGIYSGRVILMNDEVYSYVLAKPEKLGSEIKAQLLALGSPQGKIRVEEISAENIQAQQIADMEYIDYILED